jgi:hypothetical protein
VGLDDRHDAIADLAELEQLGADAVCVCSPDEGERLAAVVAGAVGV